MKRKQWLLVFSQLCIIVSQVALFTVDPWFSALLITVCLSVIAGVIATSRHQAVTS